MLTKLFRRQKSPVAVDVLTGYAHWAKTYPPHAHNPLMELEQQAMLSLIPADLTGQACLDLACGSGRYLRLLQAREATFVTGLDISPHMLQQLKTNDNSPSSSPPRLPASSPPHFLASTFLALPFPPATFQLITCGLAVGHEKNLNRVLAEAARILQPGGSLIYSDFHPFGALLGWQRSFSTTDGQVFQLEHYVHLYSHHAQACRLAGLAIMAVQEPLLGQHAPSPQFQNIPAVLVIQATKPDKMKAA